MRTGLRYVSKVISSVTESVAASDELESLYFLVLDHVQDRRSIFVKSPVVEANDTVIYLAYLFFYKSALLF